MIEDIFQSRFEEVQPLMRHIAYHWSDDCPADREDILQEMALKLYLVLRRWPDAPHEYVMAALRRVPLDYRARGSSVSKIHHKKRRHHWHTISLDAILDESDGGGGRRYHPRWGDVNVSPVEDMVVAELMYAQLKERLNPRQVAFLELRLMGYGVDEVGKQLGLNRTQTNNVAIAIRAHAKTLWQGEGPVAGEDYATVDQAAAELGLSPMTVRYHCQRGSFPGVIKQRWQWLIPRPVQRPKAPVKTRDPKVATVNEVAKELYLRPVTVSHFAVRERSKGPISRGGYGIFPCPFASMKNTRNSIIVITVIMVSLAIILALSIAIRFISMPIRSLTRAMGRLAGGDLSAEIGNADREDEIGEMARALEIFRQNAIDKDATEKLLAQSESKYRLLFDTMRGERIS